MNYFDQLEREIKIEETPKRIVSLVPSQTELLFDLGLETSIVGITKFCVHPEELRKYKTVVGGTKEVHLDKIRSLKPDIILCNKEENTKVMIEELETIAPVHISDIYTIADSIGLINMYGEMFNVETKAASLVFEIQNAYQEFQDLMMDQPKLKVAYFIWKQPWMVAASSTFIDEMLRINNFDNYFSNLTRYPEINLDDIDDSIDLLLFSSEPYPFQEKHLKEIYNLFPVSKVKIVNGEYFSWYGSRLKMAFRNFEMLRKTLN